ncbi:hypothetical protein SKAU_G00252050 [Synaphobranchus kaupii]|uniref:Uncharacterized protein n=1 Tax=Synaphobranchus kaupii TaxID=118154 RepID=A0A9Q1IRY9_SYNKA|nr:hypothetical protein SKAU_G00252050 [Synaphobranchus kaupii]
MQDRSDDSKTEQSEVPPCQLSPSLCINAFVPSHATTTAPRSRGPPARPSVRPSVRRSYPDARPAEPRQQPGVLSSPARRAVSGSGFNGFLYEPFPSAASAPAATAA